MPFEIRKPYRALNGAELKEILVERLKAAMDLDATLNLVRSFPLVKYKVSVTLTPYIKVGIAATDVKPEREMLYEVYGEEFMQVQGEILELVEESPIYGVEADPQALRKLTTGEVIDTRRTDTGELVDARIRERGAEGPPERIGRQMQQPVVTQPERPVDGTLAPATLDERLGWTPADPNNPGGKMQELPGYEAMDNAVGASVQRGRVPPEAAGRVSMLRPGGQQDHGRRGQQ